MKLKSFEDMPIWKNAFDLADKIYDIAEGFPRTELHSLTSQIKRAGISVSGNIAESYGRYHILEKIQFFYYARGSLCEVKSYLLFALKRGYVKEDVFSHIEEDISMIHKELNTIIKSLKLNYKK